jgi:hypothetical protein
MYSTSGRAVHTANATLSVFEYAMPTPQTMTPIHNLKLIRPPLTTTKALRRHQALNRVHFNRPRSIQMNPRLIGLKAERFGSTAASAVASAPNQLASVAANWSTAIVGIQRPRSLASSGPDNSSVGIVP